MGLLRLLLVWALLVVLLLEVTVFVVPVPEVPKQVVPGLTPLLAASELRAYGLSPPSSFPLPLGWALMLPQWQVGVWVRVRVRDGTDSAGEDRFRSPTSAFGTGQRTCP